MAKLDALTTDEALQTYRALYDKCACCCPEAVRARKRRGVWDVMGTSNFLVSALTHIDLFSQFRGLYGRTCSNTCVLRDTPDAGKMELVRKELTLD
eukprot:1250853-Pleurochrysis_carterae.AAC.3